MATILSHPSFGCACFSQQVSGHRLISPRHMVKTVVCPSSYKTDCFSRNTRTRSRNTIWCGTGESLFALESDMEGQAENNGESTSTYTAPELRTPTFDAAVGALKLGGKYDRELEVARRAVHLACALCQRVQDRLLRNEEKTNTKNDSSFVTVADWSVQTVISWVLSQYYGEEHISMIAKEDTQALSGMDGNELLQGVVSTVNECLSEAVMFGLESPLKSLGTLDVLNAIKKGRSKGGPSGRHWVLDPVDGTLGFVRGDQYAIALAMIEDGEVVLGVLGCPNYPMRREWLNYHHRYYQLMSMLVPPGSGVWSRGCVISAQKGSGQAWMEPLVNDIIKSGLSTLARPVTVSSIDDPALATFCEPVEKENSSHSFTEGLAYSLGLRNRPLRVYSIAKYAAIARGDAEIFMKFARAGYKEKVWDHAAGVLIIQEAGGVVTDAGGSPLTFQRGST